MHHHTVALRKRPACVRVNRQDSVISRHSQVLIGLSRIDGWEGPRASVWIVDNEPGSADVPNDVKGVAQAKSKGSLVVPPIEQCQAVGDELKVEEARRIVFVYACLAQGGGISRQ